MKEETKNPIGDNTNILLAADGGIENCIPPFALAETSLPCAVHSIFLEAKKESQASP